MLGIVVLNYKTYEDTVLCVESIKNTVNCEYAIYVVDNKSPDDSFVKLKNRLHDEMNVVVVESKKNGGYSAGNNIGIKLALKGGACAVLIVNSDVVFYENSIDIIYKCLIDNKNVGVVGPKVVLQDGSSQHLIRKNYTFLNYMFSKKPLIYLDFFSFNKKTMYKNYKYDSDLFFYGCLSGCCIGLSKSYFEKSGLLDENIFLYYEEAVIGINAKKNNLLTCFTPRAKVLHKSSLSVGRKNSAFMRYHRYYSSLYMLRRYVGLNVIQYSLTVIINFTPFFVNSLFKKEYRLMFKDFFSRCLLLYKPLK